MMELTGIDQLWVYFIYFFIDMLPTSSNKFMGLMQGVSRRAVVLDGLDFSSEWSESL